MSSRVDVVCKEFIFIICIDNTLNKYSLTKVSTFKCKNLIKFGQISTVDDH